MVQDWYRIMGKLTNYTKILKALADENRLRILALLKASENIKKDICVCEIQSIIGLSQPTISSHLKVLENAELIEYKKNGLWVNYYLRRDVDEDIKALINSILDSLKGDEQIRDDCKKAGKTNRIQICKK